CAGRDLSELKGLTDPKAAETRAELTMQLHLAFSKMDTPVVTAINGAAMGGGAGLAIAGDIAVMAESAKIGYPETKHGIVAAIVMANLVRQIGHKAAFELVALGEPLGAARALELGVRVIKVEQPGSGDETRTFEPQLARDSAYYFACNRSKESITVNLRSDDGRQLIRELAEKADVLVENFPVGTLGRYGLDFAS